MPDHTRRMTAAEYRAAKMQAARAKAPELHGGVTGSEHLTTRLSSQPTLTLRLNGRVLYEGKDLMEWGAILSARIVDLWRQGKIDAAWIDAGFHTMEKVDNDK